MKNLRKTLALLSAVLLLTASVTGCNSDTDSDATEGNTTQNTSVTTTDTAPDNSAVEPFDPETLLRKLKSADEVMIKINESDVHEDYGVTYSFTSETAYVRDQNAVKYYSYQKENERESNVNRYYDLSNKLLYNEDGRSWVTEPLYESWADIGWTLYLTDYIDLKPFVNGDPWKFVDGKCVFTDEMLTIRRDTRRYEGDPTIEITADGNTYTIKESMTGDEDWLSYSIEIVITFADMTVELPAAR